MTKHNVSALRRSGELAGVLTDPALLTGAFGILPNPDTILRKLGKQHTVYEALLGDAHVISELRSMRSGLLRYEYSITAASDIPADQQARDLCEQVFAAPPDNHTQWADRFWTIFTAVLRGYAVHEVVWEYDGRWLLPSRIIDRPTRRFIFTPEGEPRLITRAQPALGEELPPHRFLITRHMPSSENPYGVAVLSSCFWPYTFKHQGFGWFARFAERFGMPWPIGKVPMGTATQQIEEIVDQLVNLIEDGAGVVPEGTEVDMLATTAKGEVYYSLIQMCNAEMSKALTSQTLATEITGEGSFAASQTHAQREDDVNESDRELVSQTLNQLLAWITELNVPGATPPEFRFYEDQDVSESRANVVNAVRQYLDVPVQWASEYLGIPLPEDGEATIPRSTAPSAAPGASPFDTPSVADSTYSHRYNRSTPAAEAAAAAANAAIEPWLASLEQTIAEYRDSGKTVNDVIADLPAIFAKLDTTDLTAVSVEALQLAYAQGLADD